MCKGSISWIVLNEVIGFIDHNDYWYIIRFISSFRKNLWELAGLYATYNNRHASFEMFYNQCWIGTFVIWVELYPTTIDFFALDHSIVTESLWTNNCFYVEKDANKSHTKCNSSKQFKFPCNKFLFTHEHTIDCVLCKSLIVYVCIACFYWYKTEVFTET